MLKTKKYPSVICAMPLHQCIHTWHANNFFNHISQSWRTLEKSSALSCQTVEDLTRQATTWRLPKQPRDFQTLLHKSIFCKINSFVRPHVCIPLFYIIADGGGECPLKPFRHKSAFCNNSICDQVMPDVDGQSIWRGTKVGSGESYQIDPS